MLAIRSLVRSSPNLIKNVAQQRNMSAITVPARNKISKGEVFFLASAMCVGWSIVPVWVLLNIKHYRDRDE